MRPAPLVLIYRPRKDGRLSWSCVAGRLHTEINVPQRELNRDTVAHLNTNLARRRLTSLIETNGLTTMPDHQLQSPNPAARVGHYIRIISTNTQNESVWLLTDSCCSASVYVHVRMTCSYGQIKMAIPRLGFKLRFKPFRRLDFRWEDRI